MPFGPYPDFAACVADNSDKENPEAYCAVLEQLLKEDAERVVASAPMRLQIVARPENAFVPTVDVLADLLEGIDEVAEDIAGPDEDFHALVILEGVWTGDGRYFEEGAFGWRNLPLPLMALDKTTEAHMEARLIGNFTRLERIGREIHGWGTFVESDDPEVLNLQRLVRNGDIRGISADLDDVEIELLAPMEPAMPRTEGDLEVMPWEEPLMRFTKAVIMGATVVPFPAFKEAYVESLAALTAALAVAPEVTGHITAQSYDGIDFVAPQGAREEAERGLEWRREHGRGGTDVGVARARDIANGKNLSPDTVRRMVSYFARHEVDKQGEGWSPGQPGFPSAGRIAWALWGGDPGRTWAEKVARQMDSVEDGATLVAATYPISAPLMPPADWFSDPNLNGPTPMTVDDSGRIVGHLATWDTCHVGFTDQCVTPPRSAAAYRHFTTGEIICDDGSRLPVGQITMDTSHAPLNANAARAAAHYDDTGLVVADVVCGEDRYGIWMAGALRPDIEPEKIRALMASDVSGDWRRIGSALELVGVLAVNVPGFPKVRHHEGLVASMVASLAPKVDIAPDVASRITDRIARSIGRDKAQRIEEIRGRVKGDK